MGQPRRVSLGIRVSAHHVTSDIITIMTIIRAGRYNPMPHAVDTVRIVQCWTLGVNTVLPSAGDNRSAVAAAEVAQLLVDRKWCIGARYAAGHSPRHRHVTA